jgi:hypothetical protein
LNLISGLAFAVRDIKPAAAGLSRVNLIHSCYKPFTKPRYPYEPIGKICKSLICMGGVGAQKAGAPIDLEQESPLRCAMQGLSTELSTETVDNLREPGHGGLDGATGRALSL